MLFRSYLPAGVIKIVSARAVVMVSPFMEHDEEQEQGTHQADTD